jgi:hypothetical protein
LWRIFFPLTKASSQSKVKSAGIVERILLRCQQIDGNKHQNPVVDPSPNVRRGESKQTSTLQKRKRSRKKENDANQKLRISPGKSSPA